MQNELKPCPFCGSEKGYWSSHRLTQYYDLAGEPHGYSFSGSALAKNVHCLGCRKTISLARIQKINRRVDNG